MSIDNRQSDAGEISRENYGEDYRSHLLEQYKVFVATAEAVSQRRATTNNYLLSINTFLITLYGLGPTFEFRPGTLMLFCLAGSLVSGIWYGLIRSYRLLNTAKYKVIGDIENRLPEAPFSREWEIAEKVLDSNYIPLTKIEQLIPTIFLILYVLLGLHAIL